MSGLDLQNVITENLIEDLTKKLKSNNVKHEEYENNLPDFLDLLISDSDYINNLVKNQVEDEESIFSNINVNYLLLIKHYTDILSIKDDEWLCLMCDLHF